jgi:hypothetical protein
MRVMSGDRLQEERRIPYVLGQWSNLVEGRGEGH